PGRRLPDGDPGAARGDRRRGVRAHVHVDAGRAQARREDHHVGRAGAAARPRDPQRGHEPDHGALTAPTARTASTARTAPTARTASTARTAPTARTASWRRRRAPRAGRAGPQAAGAAPGPPSFSSSSGSLQTRSRKTAAAITPMAATTEAPA